MLMLTAETRIPIPRNCLFHISGVHKLMNKFVTTAVGLLAVGSISSADPSDTAWLGLDSEINAISSSIATNDHGIGMAALIRLNYAYGTDDISNGGAPGASDVSGFRFDDIDLAFWSNIGDYVMRVSMDLAGGTGSATRGFELQDAFIGWTCPEDLNMQAGRMNPEFMHDGNAMADQLFFMDRSAIGSATYGYDEGLQISGTVQDFLWFFGLFNGSTFQDSDHTFYLRGEYNLGEGDGGHEGAHEKAAGTNLTLGLGVSIDNTQTGDQTNIGLDVHGNHDRFGIDFSYLMIDNDDASLTTDPNNEFGVLSTPLTFDKNSNPMSFAVTYDINADWSVGIRAESLDNTMDNELLTIGANYYGAGHGSRWQFNWTDVSADGANLDGSYFQAGYVVGFSE